MSKYRINFFLNKPKFKLTKNNLTMNNNISYNLKQILINNNPEEFKYLGYSTIKYTCKTREQIKFEKNYPFG